MKILIVYYSRNGTTKKLAKDLSDSLLENNIDLHMLEIEDKKNRLGIFNWIRAGRDAFAQKLTEISYDPLPIDTYDKVLIGTPIWAGRITPAIRTFLNENKTKLKEVAFFSSAGGNKFNNIFSEMENILEKKPISVIGFQKKIILEKNEAYITAIKQFVKQLL